MLNKSDRIALAQLLVELAAVVAFGLAAVEFALAQRGPKLRVLYLKHGDHRVGKNLNFTIKHDQNGRIGLRFGILLENLGPVAGRWIKVRLEEAHIRPHGSDINLLSFQPIAQPATGTWQQVSGERAFTFIGKDSFVSYPQPEKENSMRKILRKEGIREYYSRAHLEDLGEFEFIVEIGHVIEGTILLLLTLVWADRFVSDDHWSRVTLERLPEPKAEQE